MNIKNTVCIALSAMTLAWPLSALAQGHERDGGRGPARGEFRGSEHWRGDIGRFHERDAHHWAEGHWYHGRHEGRLGWWWVIGGLDAALWYSYATPIYPYPDPYTPATTIVVQPAEPVVVAPPPDAPAIWYFCRSSNTYYPYVSSCPEGWERVPATPPR